MAFWQWSKTAASNASADPSINYAEGQSPSSVNDSARAMMARLAEERDDFSGLLVTAGTTTAYTVTTNQILNTPTPTEGQMISITVHLTNGISPTLSADGGTALAILSAPGVPVPAGTLIQGSPYVLRYNTTNNGWMLRSFYGSPYSVPLGAMLPYTGNGSPNSNFVAPFGQAISRTTYASYFALVSTTYGAGDGLNTFNIPDLRQRTMYGWGGMGAIGDPGRMSSTYFSGNPNTLGAVGGADHLFVNQTNLPNINLPSTLAVNDTRTWGLTGSNHAVQFIGGAGLAGGTVFTDVANAPVTVTGGAIGLTGTTTTGGSNTPIAGLPPGIMVSFILRIL